MHAAQVRESRTALVLGDTKTPSRTMKSAKPGGSANKRLRKVTCSKAGYHSVQEHATSSCADIRPDKFNISAQKCSPSLSNEVLVRNEMPGGYERKMPPALSNFKLHGCRDHCC